MGGEEMVSDSNSSGLSDLHCILSFLASLRSLLEVFVSIAASKDKSHTRLKYIFAVPA